MVEPIVGELARSRKYAHLCPETLERVAAWAVARYPSPAEAVGAARRKLHQVYGAFLDPRTGRDVERLVEALPEDPSVPLLRETCRRILGLHASTAERLPYLDGLYPELFGDPPPRRVLDLACGLHPFALPWMGLPHDAAYVACDIDTRLAAATDAFFARVGIPGRALCHDVLASLPEADADVVLVLKALPCLEQQEKGAGPRLLSALRAPRVVVSFPARTLGGRDVGMRAHYGALMEEVAGALGVDPREIRRPNETFYVLAR